MPDTGAPWNIPYVAGTDLVSDWPTDSLALANAVASGLDAANVGIGSNVVQTVKTDTFATSVTGYQDVTGLSVAITPSSASSKILLIAQVNVSHTDVSSAHAYIDITGGNAGNYIGDAASNRTRVISGMGFGSGLVGGLDESLYAAIAVYLDSPATTSSITYQVRVHRNTGTTHVNRGPLDSDISFAARGASSITAIEVAA